MIDIKNSYLLSEKKKDLMEFYSKNLEKNDEIFAFIQKPEYKSCLENIDNLSKTLLKNLPVAIKDNIAVKGYTNSCCSKILENYRPTYNADVIETLLSNGAFIAGKTNMDEFAMGSSCENSCYKPTKNPLNYDFIPGGSSGGSAAAVAAGMVPVALGSDTGGSVRQPASLCGIWGFKPSWGAISRYGLTAFASSFDEIGVLSSNFYDLTVVFDLLAHVSPHDMTTGEIKRNEFLKNSMKILNYKNSNQKLKYLDLLKDIKDKKLKIGILKGLDRYISCEQTKNEYFNQIEFFKKEGHEVIELSVSVPLDLPLATYYIIAPAEASSNLARYDGIRYGKKVVDARQITKSDLFENVNKLRSENFGKEVLRRIIIGNFVLSSGYQDKYYSKAQDIRQYLISIYNNFFENVDLIFTPTTPSYLKKIGQQMSVIDIYSADLFTVTANIIGSPAISVPYAFNRDNKIGIGMHLMAKPGNDSFLLESTAILYNEIISDSV